MECINRVDAPLWHGHSTPKCIGVPEVNGDSIRMVLIYGFKSTEPSIRMYLGERKDYEKHIYGILSPEKGWKKTT